MSELAPIEHPSWLTTGDFTEADEPLRLFAAWFADAPKSEPRDPTAMSLATVDADGLPNVRMVLMKGFDERGFVFYTNLDSPKGRELDATHRAALLFHWKSSNRQVRLRGPAERVDDAEADAYFATRPRLAQIGAWASKQSAPLESRLAFEKAIALTPRNSWWAPCRDRRIGPAFGCPLLPWSSGKTGHFRLHDRIEFRRAARDAPWSKTRLYP